ncbi:response regulator [Candidatus Sumerlaeota bacterium]|nr:response regulator [Candidatus Sumerlaeota bacterium]
MNQSEVSPLQVLVVDDELQTLQSCKIVLRASGIENVICCDDSREVMSLLHKYEIGVILLDLTMPSLPGEELLPMIREEFPYIVWKINEVLHAPQGALLALKASPTLPQGGDVHRV